jgi:hypothetical protein
MVLLAFAARTYRLGVPNLTNDEWFMVRNIHEGPWWIVNQARTFEPHPLIYYLGLTGWAQVAGETEFALRFVSVAAGMLTLVAVIALAGRLGGQVAAAAAATLVALNPYLIAQSQNARNYAPVTAFTAIALLLFLRAWQRDDWRPWIFAGGAALLALNTHLNALLAIGALWVVGGITLAWKGELPVPGLKDGTRRGRLFLISQTGVAVLLLVWIAYAWPALSSYTGYFPAPVTLETVVRQTLLTFSVGQYSTLGPGLLKYVTGALVVALATIGAYVAYRRYPFGSVATCFTIAVPLIASAALFLVRPMFEERYLIVLVPGFLALAGVGLSLPSRIHPALLVAIPLVGFAGTLPSTIPYYSAVAESRPDFRAMARWVERDARPTDVVVATGHGIADMFGYYYRGDTQLLVIADPTTADAEWGRLLARAPSAVWLLPYFDQPADLIGHRKLATLGFPAPVRWFSGTRAHRIGLPSPAQLPTGAVVTPESRSVARWEHGLALDEFAITTRSASPGDLIGVALIWRAENDGLWDDKVSVRLVAPDGEVAAQTDRRPVDDLAGFGLLKPGELLRDGVGIVVPEGTPPGEFRLELVVYDPKTGQARSRIGDAGGQAQSRLGHFTLGMLSVLPPSRPGDLSDIDVPRLDPVGFGPLQIVGRTEPPEKIQAGHSFTIDVAWLASQRPLSDLRVRIQLVGSEGAMMTDGPLLDSYPTSLWQPGDAFRARYRVPVAASATSGDHQVRLAVLNSDGQLVNEPLKLGIVTVIAPERSYARPDPPRRITYRLGDDIELIGVAIPERSRRGQTLPVTLYWHALATATGEYKVFIHLIADAGQPRAQRDQAPLNGSRPTNGWVAGEYLTDVHDLVLPPDLPPGDYQIAIGMYDPVTGARLAAIGPDGRTQDDRILLGTVTVGE